MLAISTTHSLTFVNAASIKSGQPFPSHNQLLDSRATALAWAQDNSALFVAVEGNLNRHDGAGQFERTVHSYRGDVSGLVVKDKSNTVIYALDNKVHVLDCGTGKITCTFDAHATPITSLSLSNDGSLLALVSSGSCTVHNLSHASQSILRGLPSGQGQSNKTPRCSFHPHTRTRLLLGIGKQLLIYDTSRPSGPIKTISLSPSNSASGDIVAIACSPFSKTLVAIACSGGSVSLVDLDKEKGAFKTLDMKVPLTSASFTRDGSNILLGTEHGRLLVLDLRGVDKPPKRMTVNEDGDRVVGLAIQGKVRTGTSSALTPTAIATEATARLANTVCAVGSNPLAPQDTNSPQPTRRTPGATTKKLSITSTAVASPTRIKAVNGAAATPGRKLATATFHTPTLGRPKKSTNNENSVKKKAFSPTRADLKASESASDISVQLETLTGVGKPKFTATSPLTSPASSSKTPTGKERERDGRNVPRARTVPAMSRSPGGSGVVSKMTMHTAASNVANGARVHRTVGGTRTRTVSGSSSATSTSGAIMKESSIPPVPTLPPLLATGKHKERGELGLGSKPVAKARTSSSTSVQSQPRQPTSRRSSATLNARAGPESNSRTPTPELPSISKEPVSPVVARGFAVARGAISALGLGTPDVDEWIQAGEGGPEYRREEEKRNGIELGTERKKRVGFITRDNASTDEGHEEEAVISTQGQRSNALPTSPRRPMPTATSSSSNSELQLSPLRGLANPPLHVHNDTGARPGPGSGGAQDLLRAVVRDVMYDFRQEARDEVLGLHLDLVKLGRTWKSELRAVMGEYVDDLKALMEENRRLREENDRLVRRY